MATILPNNWLDFQHYKNRRPPWIKLYRHLLDDQAYMCLPIASKALAPCIWLLASESENGHVDASVDKLAWRLRMDKSEVLSGLKPLIEKGFFIVVDGDASEVLAECLQDATPEKRQRREEKNTSATQTVPDGFDEFWDAYDRKVGKPNAIKEWLRINPDAELASTIVKQAKLCADNTEQKFRKHPERWLKGRHWEDEISARSTAPDGFDPKNPFDDPNDLTLRELRANGEWP